MSQNDIEFIREPYVILTTPLNPFAPHILQAHTDPFRPFKQMNLASSGDVQPSDTACSFPRKLPLDFAPKDNRKAPFEQRDWPYNQTLPSLLAVKRIKKVDLSSVQWESLERGIAIHQYLSSSSSPGIVRLLDVLENRSCLYLVMERLDGDLVNLLQKRAEKRLAEGEARAVFRMAAEIVGHLHDHGIVHRDLKLENFLIAWDTDQEGVKELRLTDFDSSNYMKCEPFEYSCGSPSYSAPEVCTYHPNFSGRIADIWSLGIMLYVLVCGTFPWHHPNLLTLFQMIRTEDLYLPPHLSPHLADLLQNILQKAPSKRFSLQQILGHEWLR